MFLPCTCSCSYPMQICDPSLVGGWYPSGYHSIIHLPRNSCVYMYTQISLFSQISLPAPVVVIMSMCSLLVHKDDVGGINFPVVNWPTFTSNSMFLSIICDLVSQPMSPIIGSCPLKLKLITELGRFNTGFYLAHVLVAILCRYVTVSSQLATIHPDAEKPSKQHI